ncbi:MAG TPA: helix-turn-helix domain-containing protein [Candidatus Limnocylindrales bacterium]|nr:helix-turn-helix domain-containing protein [Candidatus Limnocylindrales bacterium]
MAPHDCSPFAPVRSAISDGERSAASLADVTIRITFGRACRETRLRLDITQQDLADAVGVSRGYIGRVELGQVNVTIDLIERIAERLGQRLEFAVAPPTFLSTTRSHDRVHAWCVEAVARRLLRAGWRVAREVDVADGRGHAWIDLLAFDPETGTLLVIEIKTRLDDLGGLQRQIGWYERYAAAAAQRLGWRAQRTATWLVALGSDEVEEVIRRERLLFDGLFPGRAGHMLDVIERQALPTTRAVALVDPASKRRAWLIRTRLDGRRSTLSYRGYADAARRHRS